MNINLQLHPYWSYYYYQMNISKRYKIIFVLILLGHTNLFHDLKQYHSLENAETKKYIFKLRY